MAVQSLGNPQITGKTLDALRISTQFWMQQAFNHLDRITGLRGTPQLFSTLDAQGNAISNLALATNPNDAVTKAQTLILGTVAGTQTPAFNAGGTTSISVAGTANRISTSGTTTLSVGGTVSTLDIAATYVGQASITTLGTIGT